MVPCDLEESRLREIEVQARRIAPAAIVIRERVVRGAEVGCSDRDRRWEAPLGVVDAFYFVAGAAGEPIVEERGAEGCSVRAVALAVQVAVATGTSWRKKEEKENKNATQIYQVHLETQYHGIISLFLLEGSNLAGPT